MQKKIKDVQFSFYSTPFVSFKTVFTFYVATKQKRVCVGSFFTILGGGSHRPGKIINKKFKHNPGITDAVGFFLFNNLYLEALIWPSETILKKKITFLLGPETTESDSWRNSVPLITSTCLCFFL